MTLLFSIAFVPLVKFGTTVLSLLVSEVSSRRRTQGQGLHYRLVLSFDHTGPGKQLIVIDYVRIDLIRSCGTRSIGRLPSILATALHGLANRSPQCFSPPFNRLLFLWFLH